MASRKPEAKAKKPVAKKKAVKKPARPVRRNDTDQDGLTAEELRFIDEYLVDLHGTDAMLRCTPGITRESAQSRASMLLSRPKVQKRLAKRMERMSEVTGITAARVLQELWSMATADVNDLVEYRRTCCRHCYGKGFEFQRTAQEMRRDRETHEEATAKKIADGVKPSSLRPFDERGGIGYDARLDPNADCPECFGEGVSAPFIKDTRHLLGPARALYAGVKRTKEGEQIMLFDKGAAIDKLMRHLGLYKEDNSQKGGELAELVKLIQERSGKLPIKG